MQFNNLCANIWFCKVRIRSINIKSITEQIKFLCYLTSLSKYQNHFLVRKLLSTNIRSESGCHQNSLARYQLTVFFNPSSSVIFGFHPSSSPIREASIAYLKSCPGRSFIKVIKSAYFPLSFGFLDPNFHITYLQALN